MPTATFQSARTIPTLLMRGGTSKGLFVAAEDLPPAGPQRDAVILALLGGGDRLQVDGLGGGNPSTSKLVAVGPAGADDDADLEYLYAAVSPGMSRVSYEGNCGNLTSAVVMYALHTGVIKATGDAASVTIRNLNTGVRVRIAQPLSDGAAAVEGDYRMDGVDRAGAEITTMYLDPAGSMLGTLLPTGNAHDVLPHGPRGPAKVSVVDVTSLYVFVPAGYFGLSGTEDAGVLNADAPLLAEIEQLRRQVAVQLGLHDAADTTGPVPGQPRLALVAAPPGGEDGSDAHLLVRAFPSGRFHHALSVTGAMCAAAAAFLPDTVVRDAAREPSPTQLVRVAHATGAIDVRVDLEATDGTPRIAATGVSRTARPLLEGSAFL